MKEKLERLAELWPKDSDVRVSIDGNVLWLSPGDGHHWGLSAAITHEDRANAAARTIIEDELIRLGFMVEPYYGPRYQIVDLIGGDDNRISGPNRETRTEALVDVAIQALEALNATQPTPERHISKGAPTESQLQDDKQGARQGLDGPSLGGIEE